VRRRENVDRRIAHAFRLRALDRGESCPVDLPEPGPADVVVRTVRSGVSRGTETLVFRRGVPPDQHARMRAPFHEGDFPGRRGGHTLELPTVLRSRSGDARSAESGAATRP
jgi:hypothetical protein